MSDILVIKAKNIKNDYRDIIRDTLSHLKDRYGKDYNFQKIAKFCQMQPAYLSFVFAKRSHLNADQMWGVCRFLKLSDAEHGFLKSLAGYHQSSVATRKKELEEKVLDYERQMKKISHLVQEKQKTSAPDWYRLDPVGQFVKQYVSLNSEVTKKLECSASKIGISGYALKKKLGDLEKDGLVEKDGELYTTKSIQTHLDADDPLFPSYFKSRVTFGLEQTDRIGDDEQVRFSAMFTANAEFKKELELRLRKVISWASDHIDDYEAEDIYILNVHQGQLTK